MLFTHSALLLSFCLFFPFPFWLSTFAAYFSVLRFAIALLCLYRFTHARGNEIKNKTFETLSSTTRVIRWHQSISRRDSCSFLFCPHVAFSKSIHHAEIPSLLFHCLPLVSPFLHHSRWLRTDYQAHDELPLIILRFHYIAAAFDTCLTSGEMSDFKALKISLFLLLLLHSSVRLLLRV